MKSYLRLKYRIFEGSNDYAKAQQVFGVEAVQGNEIFWYEDKSFLFGSAGYALVVNGNITKKREVVLY